MVGLGAFSVIVADTHGVATGSIGGVGVDTSPFVGVVFVGVAFVGVAFVGVVFVARVLSTLLVVGLFFGLVIFKLAVLSLTLTTISVPESHRKQPDDKMLAVSFFHGALHS